MAKLDPTDLMRVFDRKLPGLELPPLLDFVGDKKPYIIYGEEYKTKMDSKEAFAKIKKTMQPNDLLDRYHFIHIINLMDRYYPHGEEWRIYRSSITNIKYGTGRYRENTFYFYLDKSYDFCLDLCAAKKVSGLSHPPYITNPSVNRALCFSSPKVHAQASDRDFVTKMFRGAVDEQIIHFKYIENNARLKKDEAHHDIISFKEIVLAFGMQVLRKSSREELEAYIKPFGKYYAGIGARFDTTNREGMGICEVFREFHKEKSNLILVERISHRKKTSGDIKFATSLRTKLEGTKT